MFWPFRRQKSLELIYLEKIMEDLQAVKDAEDAEVAEVGSLNTKVDEVLTKLTALEASGGANPSQIHDMIVELKGAQDAAKAEEDKIDAAEAPISPATSDSNLTGVNATGPVDTSAQQNSTEETQS